MSGYSHDNASAVPALASNFRTSEKLDSNSRLALTPCKYTYYATAHSLGLRGLPPFRRLADPRENPESPSCGLDRFHFGESKMRKVFSLVFLVTSFCFLNAQTTRNAGQ